MKKQIILSVLIVASLMPTVTRPMEKFNNLMGISGTAVMTFGCLAAGILYCGINKCLKTRAHNLMCDAIQDGDEKKLSKALKAGVDPDAALFRSILRHKSSCITASLNAGADFTGSFNHSIAGNCTLAEYASLEQMDGVLTQYKRKIAEKIINKSSDVVKGSDGTQLSCDLSSIISQYAVDDKVIIDDEQIRVYQKAIKK
ncbi:MAG: hypothetical protein NTX86_01765 [Candidatus Dependentiae bacterium]|nr:hypothetical protein [Candidatus Dependentiae bacterium]